MGPQETQGTHQPVKTQYGEQLALSLEWQVSVIQKIPSSRGEVLGKSSGEALPSFLT